MRLSHAIQMGLKWQYNSFVGRDWPGQVWLPGGVACRDLYSLLFFSGSFCCLQSLSVLGPRALSSDHIPCGQGHIYNIIVFPRNVQKKSKNGLKRENWKKNNWKNQTMKKTWLNQLEFLKNWLVRFGFGLISLKLKKPNRTGSV